MSRLASEADERGAQLAFAVETLTDDAAHVLHELAELRSMVAEQRIVLNELAERYPRDDIQTRRRRVYPAAVRRVKEEE